METYGKKLSQTEVHADGKLVPWRLLCSRATGEATATVAAGVSMGGTGIVETEARRHEAVGGEVVRSSERAGLAVVSPSPEVCAGNEAKQSWLGWMWVGGRETHWQEQR